MLRLLDILFSAVGLILFVPVFLVILVVGWFDTGSPLFFQKRLGRNKKPFVLVKFRTMHVDTKSVATHMVSQSSVTKLGGFLRKTKLDELPQLWNVLWGQMSLVGPRPNLNNQKELIEHRTKAGVYEARPGITGLAQINEIDMSQPELLAKTDAEMLSKLNIKSYFEFIFLTILGRGSGDRVK